MTLSNPTLLYRASLASIINNSKYKISDMLPSEWAQSRMRVTRGKRKGKLDLSIVPHFVEPLDNAWPYSHITEWAVMAAAQIGKTTNLTEPFLCYNIDQHPCHMGLFTGHADLTEASMKRLDTTMDMCGVGKLIFSQSIRNKHNKTGDTKNEKEFPGGSLLGFNISNTKTIRQHDLEKTVADDTDAAKKSTESDGSVVSIIRKRSASFSDSKKIMWISSPGEEGQSVIESLFLSMDQRYRYVPCPKCSKMIKLEFTQTSVDGSSMAGMTWKSPNGILIPSSIEYICPECGNTFREKKKLEINQAGLWIATSESQDPKHRSYNINTLYNPPGMYSWEEIVREYMAACPEAQPKNVELYKTFINTTLGLPFKNETEQELDASVLQKNKRDYLPKVLPEEISIRIGNGRIVAITCACDLGGKIEDARIDYEVCAWDESGASWSIEHGSIGTFIPKENTMVHKVDRVAWTYEFAKDNCVWTALEEKLSTVYETESGRRMSIQLTLIDSSFFTAYAYGFCDKSNHIVIPIKGDENETFKFMGKDSPWFKQGKGHKNLQILYVGHVKEELARATQFNWNELHERQPDGFMNFPQAHNGMYGRENYFSHFSAEKRVQTKEGYRWVKKSDRAANHFYDCKVYNMVARRILIHLFSLDTQNKLAKWKDYVEWALSVMS